MAILIKNNLQSKRQVIKIGKNPREQAFADNCCVHTSHVNCTEAQHFASGTTAKTLIRN